MFLEGEFNWALVFLAAGAGLALLGLFGLWAAGRWALAYRRLSADLEQARHKAETADRRQMEILNAIPVALVQTDISGKFTFANRAAHQLLGRRDAELLGLRFHSATWGITYPDGRPVPPDLLPSARALRGQTVKGFQHLMANPATRRSMLVSVTAMPIVSEGGEVLGSTAAIVETESLTTPEALGGLAGDQALAAALTRKVFDAAASFLAVVGPGGVIRALNRTLAAPLGLDAEALAGSDFADALISESHRTETRQAIAAAYMAEPGEAEPVEVVLKDGTRTRWRFLKLEGDEGDLLMAGDRVAAEAEAVVIDSTPERDAPAPPAGAEAEVVALRERLAHESEAGREAEERAHHHEQLGRLTGGLVQDFNAMLGVLTSALEVMRDQADNPERVRRLGDVALEAGRRGEALSRRLLAFTQGADPHETAALELSGYLQGEAAALMRRGEGRVAVEPVGEPMSVRVDPLSLRAALIALIDNGLQSGGTVSLSLTREAGRAVITVADDGSGMDAETLARAREPFFTTREGQAGLGLSQVSGLARSVGGDLEIESAPGQGARVRLALPLEDDAQGGSAD
ncbi:MAG: ATP-binding protein [Brevundimonas sp.]|uniref:PAS domain-containing sensor histidine kinase n=1 Tax=Brevundimonas sp. TaxID=1871086 RepID=UPI00391C044F